MGSSRSIWVALIGIACSGGAATRPTGPGAAAEAVGVVPPTALVGEAVPLDATGSTGVRSTWVLPSGRIEGEAITFTPTAPGHLSLFLEVEGADGSTDTASFPLTVTWPTQAQPPVSSGPLAADDDHLWAVLPDHGLLVQIDPRSRTVVDHHPTCGDPRAITRVQGSLIVACAAVDAVAVHDPGGALIEQLTLPWGSRPVAVAPLGDDAVVALQGLGQLATIHLSPITLGPLVDAVPDVRGLASSDAVVIASRHRSPDTGGEAVALSPTLSDPVPWSLPLDEGPDSDTNARGLPSYTHRVAVRPDGRVAVIGGLKANIERGLFREDQPLTFDTTVRADLRVFALDPGEGSVHTQIDTAVFDDRDLVSAIAFSPRGDWLFVAHLGMETVDVLDAYTLSRSGSIQGIGAGPDGLWISPEGAELWVLASLDRQLVVYDLLGGVATPTEIARVGLQPPSGEVLDPEVLQGKIVFHRSADPRMSEQGYLSCASCHLDGEDDGRTWDFTQRGEGLRNTISLLGRAGTAHGPIHWSGNFDEIQDFENDIRGSQGGRGFLSEEHWAEVSDPLGAPKAGLSEELDALAAYVATLDQVGRSPHRAPDGSLPQEAIEGQAVFLDPEVGCVTCHPPPSYTDSQFIEPGVPLLHDVGTLTPASGGRRGGPLWGIDTPTLHVLWATAPYLHDGSAPDL